MADDAPERGNATPRRVVRRAAVILMTALIAFLLLAVAGLLLFQHGLTYFPRPYEPSYRMGFPPGMVEIEYTASAGSQTAFYLPPSDNPDSPPGRLWVMVGGNASLALDWADLIVDVKDSRAGYLLIDYPGYGNSRGKASSKRMLESCEAAMQTLAKRLKVKPERLEADINYLGHSMGCAAVLQLAARHKANRIILVAPFTSLLDMARLTAGWPLCYTLLDPYDTRARRDELAERLDPPAVHIFHGTADNIVPFRMGVELSERQPGLVTFHRIQGGDHNWVIEMSRKDILRLMSEK